jgi:type IX secretion system PorP/SprF family membrane protein
MKIFLPLLFISLLSFNISQAQQRPQYSQYMVNNYMLNPAITGIEDYTDVRLGYRDQWRGIEGAPVTAYLSVHGSLGRDNNIANPGLLKHKRPTFNQYQSNHNVYKKVRPHHGLGAMIMTDKIGPFHQTEAHVTYAYHILLTENLKLAQGASAGIRQYALNTSMIRLGDPNDDAIGSGTITQTRPDFSVGMWLYSDEFYLGASATQLLGYKLGFGKSLVLENSQIKQHYFVTGGYKFTPTPQIAIIPSVMVKWIRPAPVSVDLNVRATYENRFWTGVSYRHKESVAVVAGFAVNYMLDIGYAYDTAIAGISRYGNGSHEIILGLRLRNRFKAHCPQNMW